MTPEEHAKWVKPTFDLNIHVHITVTPFCSPTRTNERAFKFHRSQPPWEEIFRRS